MLVGIISRPSSITSQIPQTLLYNGPWIVQKLGFPFSKSKSFHPVFIKLNEYVGGHHISTKFYNPPNPPRYSWIMALELFKIRVSALYVKEFSSDLSRPSSITCQISTPDLWPLNCPKNELAVSALQVQYPPQKCCHYHWIYTTNTTGVLCVSLAFLFKHLCIFYRQQLGFILHLITGKGYPSKKHSCHEKTLVMKYVSVLGLCRRKTLADERFVMLALYIGFYSAYWV